MQNDGSISRRNFVKSATLAATAVTTGLGLEPMSAAAAPDVPDAQPALPKTLI